MAMMEEMICLTTGRSICLLYITLYSNSLATGFHVDPASSSTSCTSLGGECVRAWE